MKTMEELREIFVQSEVFRGQKVIRACNQQRWSNVAVQSLIPAVHQVTRQLIASAFISTVAVRPRITLHDSKGKSVTGTLRSPRADYLVISDELLRGPVPDGGVPLADHLVAFIERD